MKTIKILFLSLYVSLGSLLPLSVVVVPAVALTACKSSQTAIVYKSMLAIQQTVSVSLGLWADHVVAERSRIDAITDEAEKQAATEALDAKEETARASLETYKAAVAASRPAVELALKSKTAPAPPTVLESGTNFADTIKELTK